jgi:hypothetical protein
VVRFGYTVGTTMPGSFAICERNTSAVAASVSYASSLKNLSAQASIKPAQSVVTCHYALLIYSQHARVCYNNACCLYGLKHCRCYMVTRFTRRSCCCEQCAQLQQRTACSRCRRTAKLRIRYRSKATEDSTSGRWTCCVCTDHTGDTSAWDSVCSAGKAACSSPADSGAQPAAHLDGNLPAAHPLDHTPVHLRTSCCASVASTLLCIFTLPHSAPLAPPSQPAGLAVPCTWPRLAAATGSSEIWANTAFTGRPQACSMTSRAASVGKGGTRSCMCHSVFNSCGAQALAHEKNSTRR